MNHTGTSGCFWKKGQNLIEFGRSQYGILGSRRCRLFAAWPVVRKRLKYSAARNDYVRSTKVKKGSETHWLQHDYAWESQHNHSTKTNEHQTNDPENDLVESPCSDLVMPCPGADLVEPI